MVAVRLLAAGGGEDGRGAALDDVGDAVELGACAGGSRARARTTSSPSAARPMRDLRDDGEGAAHAGEAGGLGEAAELDGDVARAGDFVDRVGNAGSVM